MSATAITRIRLLAVTGVTDIVGNRIFPSIVEAGKSLPAIAIVLSGQSDSYNISGADHYPRSRVTVMCFGRSAIEADKLGEAVEAGLKDFRGQVALSARTYSAIFMKDPSDGAYYEEEVGQHRRSSDYTLMWR